ncbi:hypothetical protein [Turicimonas sp. TL08]
MAELFSDQTLQCYWQRVITPGLNNKMEEEKYWRQQDRVFKKDDKVGDRACSLEADGVNEIQLSSTQVTFTLDKKVL